MVVYHCLPIGRSVPLLTSPLHGYTNIYANHITGIWTLTNTKFNDRQLWTNNFVEISYFMVIVNAENIGLLRNIIQEQLKSIILSYMLKLEIAPHNFMNRIMVHLLKLRWRVQSNNYADI